MRVRDHAFVSCYWFAYNFQWGALLPIVLPAQIALVAGESGKEFWNGVIPALGALLSLFVTPLAGAISDRSRSRFGRRRPFMAWGTAINIVFLLFLASFGRGSALGVFLLCTLGVQFGSNWAGGPYAGLIPDVVPGPERGVASGWLALMTATGFLIGAVIAGALVSRGAFHPIDLTIACVLVAALVATVAGVREARGAPPASGWRELLRSFIPRGPEYRNFYLVLLTRGFVTLGIFSIFTFFQYFLADILRVPDPPAQTGYLIAVIIGAGIPTSLLGGALSDRYGRKPLVYLSGGLMAVASVVFAAVAHRPSLQFLHGVGLVFGLGYGAYQAVDWALAVDVLPRGESAAKDMGIWHVSLVLPQVVAPALTGMILTAFKGTSLLLGYTVVFVLTAAWFILGTVLVSKIRGVR